MTKGSMDELLKAMIKDEVESQLKQYKDMMEKLAQKVPAASAPKAAKADRPRRAVKAVISDAALAAVVQYKIDQVVSYKQGRGAFNAKVIGIDVAKGMLKVQRIGDGKVVDRPADKVYAAAAEVPAAAPAAEPVAMPAAPTV